MKMQFIIDGAALVRLQKGPRKLAVDKKNFGYAFLLKMPQVIQLLSCLYIYLENFLLFSMQKFVTVVSLFFLLDALSNFINGSPTPPSALCSRLLAKARNVLL